jgi:ATP-dependent helicase HrpA
MAGVHELEAQYRAKADAYRGRPQPAALREARWLLEELRMSHFAQGLGVHGQVSAKRVRKVLDSVGG